MGSMLLQINLERILILHTRGIIREGEMTNSLIDSLLSTEPLGPEAITVFLRTVPAKVQEALKAGLRAVHVRKRSGMKCALSVSGRRRRASNMHDR